MTLSLQDSKADANGDIVSEDTDQVFNLWPGQNRIQYTLVLTTRPTERRIHNSEPLNELVAEVDGQKHWRPREGLQPQTRYLDVPETLIEQLKANGRYKDVKALSDGRPAKHKQRVIELMGRLVMIHDNINVQVGLRFVKHTYEAGEY